MKIRPLGDELFHEERKTDGQADGREDGQADGREDGQADGREDGQADRKDEANCLFEILRTGPKISFCLFSFLIFQRMK